jgi:hypothetical protein
MALYARYLLGYLIKALRMFMQTHRRVGFLFESMVKYRTTFTHYLSNPINYLSP